MTEITILIRNRNEAGPLRRVLEGLRQQTLPFEVVVVDNDSTDGSADVYSEYQARVIRISKEEFTYGRALNAGFSAARTPFVLPLSAHSIPIGRTFLEECIRPFGDPRVAAAMCLELERATDWVEEQRFEQPATWTELLSAGIGNRAAAIRRDVWEKFPFDEEIEAAEDLLWCLRVINSGGYAVTRCSALFQYVATRTWKEAVRRDNRERVAVYRISGAVLNSEVSVSSVASTLLRAVPSRAAVSAVRECARYLSVRSTAWQARRKSSQGSLR